jgi:glutamate carboxypeptidase
MTSLYSFLETRQASYLSDLKALVSIDCGTHNKAGVDRVGEWVRDRSTRWDWEVEHYPQTQYGDCWLARLRGSGEGRMMLMAHLDTVYPDGTAAARPMRVASSKILGPGVCDMKSGLLSGMYALRALHAVDFADFAELLMFFSSDEEVSSPVSRAISGPIAQRMDTVLVLEAGRMNGDIVSARKGSGEFIVKVSGKAAHAGVEPEKGANAVLELAHQIIALHQLNGLAPGVTVNAGVIHGGTVSNVVPDLAQVEVDVRAIDPFGAETVQRALAELPQHTTVPGTRVELSGHFKYPPMAKTPTTAFLVELAREAARELGFDVKDAATGGASDANVIAGLGVPVLDGLGPVGGLDHSPDEYIEADSILPRTALVAELIQRIVSEPQLTELRKLRQASTEI